MGGEALGPAVSHCTGAVCAGVGEIQLRIGKKNQIFIKTQEEMGAIN